MRKNLRKTLVLTAAASALALSIGAPARALIFNFSFSGGTAEQQNAVIEAGNLWSSLLTDNITVDITMGFATLGGGTIAQATTSLFVVNYTSLKDSLATDATSADDFTAVGSLDAGSSVRTYLNRTAENGNSATPYVANFTGVVASSANLKALGFTGFSGADATITFNNLFAQDFDYDRTDGIGAGLLDFVGVTAHEIGHSLGFFSTVDFLGANAGASEVNFEPTTLDLFRYSTDSINAAGGKAIDITADNRQKFFSVDGSTPATGNPTTSSFSNGVNFGDGQQASHWKDGLGIGILDPTAAPGELLQITELDLRAFDAIGFNRAVVLPEPSTFALMGLGGVLLGGVAVRRQRRRPSESG